MTKHGNNDHCLIYLADLVHNYTARGPRTFPINIGYVAAYAKKIYGKRIEIKLFKFPIDLINAIKDRNPHIIGLSNYIWNLDLNNKIAAWVKALSENVIIVYGGPDHPINFDEYQNYLTARPNMDFYVLNQGEKGFANIIKRYLECKSIEGMKDQPIDNCSFYDGHIAKVIFSNTNKYIEDINEIPSPYLEGILDVFFGKKLIPLIETNRGCPYSCIYCAWTEPKIALFSLDRVKQEIRYIADKIDDVDSLRIVDANFGMFERDIELAEFLKEQKNTKGYPRDIVVSWAKVNDDRMIKAVEVLDGMIGISSSLGSFQTLDRQVMANIKRTNMTIGKFKRIQNYLGTKRISTSTELIVGLPGETKESHLKGLRNLFDCDAPAIFCYNLMMLGGTELNTCEFREKFNIETKYRLVDGAFGKYDNMLSIESEEIVLKNNTMSLDDILYFRPVHFLIQFMWNYGYYKEPLFYLKSEGINPVDVIIFLIGNRELAPLSIKTILDNFIKDTYAEWFNSDEELFEYYASPENFEDLKGGKFGKLNYKYTYKILLECKNDFDDYLYAISRNMLEARDLKISNTKEQMKDLLNYTRNIFVDFKDFFNNCTRDKIIEFKYDILMWKKQYNRKPLREFKSSGIKLKFKLPLERVQALKKLCSQFQGTDFNQTLRKMSEYINEKDLFYEVDYV